MSKNNKKFILEQEDEWVKISPEEYLEIMKFASYNAKGVSGLPKFRGKKIWITGDLNVRDLPIDSLEGIGYVEGRLDISNTDIKNISHIKVKGYISDYNSGVYKIKLKRIRDEKIAESQERRESNEWDMNNPNIGDEGLKANALFEYLYTIEEVRTEEESQELVELKNKLEELLKRQKELEQQDRDLTDIYSDIEVTEERINEISELADVYNLVPEGKHYELTQFTIIGSDLDGQEWAVGTESETIESCKEYVENMMNEGVSNMFNASFVENHIDEEAVLDYFREFYENDIWENPDVYFSDDDYELSDEQEKQIELLQSKIEELEEKQNNLEHEIEEPSEYSDAYDKLQEEIDRLEEEIEEITPDTDEPTQEMVDDKVEDMIRTVKHNIVYYMKDFGMDIENYIDKESFIDDVISEDGYGIINSYSGDYDSVTLEEYYIVMRIN